MIQIGKYQVVDKIGEGAMGIVYRAMDPVLNRPVAIKIMSEGLAQDEHLRARFLREAQAAGSLQHPNVVTIYDFGEIDGHLFIAMEFIEGIDLERLLNQGTELPLAAKLDIVIDVLNGLSYAHRRGIVHRDIKPANVRLDEDGHARIMDFGVAHLGASNLTATGTMVGTPNYMAPEQISGEPVTPASDLFSVGAMLYELLTNAKPFPGDTLHSVLFKIVSDTPVEVRTLKPELPSELTDIVTKALAKTPAQRYRTASDMANALLAVRSRLGAPRLSKTVSQRVSIDTALEEARKKRGVSRWRRPRTIVAASSAAGVILAATLLLRTGATRSATRGAAAPAAPPAQDRASTAGPRGTNFDSGPAARQTSAPEAGAGRTPGSTRASKGEPAAEPVKRTMTPARAAAGVPQPTRTRSEAPAADSPRLDPTPPSAVAAGRSTPAATAVQSAAPDTTARPVGAQPGGQPAESGISVAAPPPAAPSAPSARDAISGVIAAYAAAIGSRDVAEIRRVYPRLTAEQQSNWRGFFGAVRSIAARFEITSLDVSGPNAVTQLDGVYEYVTSAGQTQRQPISVRATLQRDAGGWTIVAIR